MSTMSSTFKLVVCILCLNANCLSQEIAIGMPINDVNKLMKAHDFSRSQAEFGQPENGVLDQWYLGSGVLIIISSTDTKKVTDISYEKSFSGKKGLRHDDIIFAVDSFSPQDGKLIVRFDAKFNHIDKTKLQKVSANQPSKLLSDQMQMSGFRKGVGLDDTERFAYSIWNINHGLLIERFSIITKDIVSMSFVEIVSGDDGFSSSAINVEAINFMGSTMTLSFKPVKLKPK